MTVATLVSTVSYTGDGVSTVYTYPFYLIDAAHLQVWVNGALQPVSAYTVFSVGNQFGGEVKLNVAPAAGINLTLRRSVPATQLVDYRPYDAFPAETHEQALDKLTMIVQEQGGFIGNAVRAPLLEPVGSFNLVLPIPSVRANFLLGFDAFGNLTTYPYFGAPPNGITDHGALTGLADNDHPQYALAASLAGTYLPLAGGTLTGALQLIPGFPVLPTEAVNKAYVDTFIGSVITKSVVSDATGDAQGTVQGAWNAQANASGITRASNEIIYYRWPAATNNVYRYVGSQQGPAGWATIANQWAASSSIVEAPLDAFIYGRKGGNWVKTIELTGGAFLGKVQGFAGAAAAADLARTDEVVALDTVAINAHVALLDPHAQYLKKAGGAVTGPVLFADGTLAAPAISFASQNNIGIYRAAIGDYRFVAGGHDLMRLTGGGVQFYDGAEPSPGISFLTDSTMGIWRAGANDLRVSIGGIGRLQLNATNFGSTVQIGAPSVTAAAGFTTFALPVSTTALHATGIMSRGAAGSFGVIQLCSTDGVTLNSVPYQWTPNPGTAVGYHDLAALAGSGTLRVLGGAYNTGAGGASLAAMFGGVQTGGIDMVVTNGAPGSQTSDIRFSIMKSGSFNTSGDMRLTVNASAPISAQFRLDCSSPTQASDMSAMSQIIVSQGGLDPSIGFYNGATGRSNGILSNDGSIYFAQQGAPGPLSGWLGQILANTGAINFGTYTNVSDRSTKDDIRPLGASLASLLRLQGIRFYNRFSKREDIGLVAQDVEPTYPELVFNNDIAPSVQDGPRTTLASLNYIGLIAPMIEAIRELNARLTTLEAKP